MKKPRPKKQRSPVWNCTQCGRDTKNRSRICSACMDGPRSTGPAKEPETPEDYYLGGDEWVGPLEE